MTDATWRFYVDWDRDGSFATSGDDVSEYVTDAAWNIGMRAAFQDVSDETQCRLTLRNDDKRFSPENAGSPYAGKMVPQRPVCVQALFNGATITMWRGWVESIQPAWNEHGELISILTGVGARQFFSQTKLYLDLYTDVTADMVLDDIMAHVTYPPSLAQAWLLGVGGFSELGGATFLADTTGGADFDVGSENFAFVGDNWEDGVDAWSAIKSLMEGERGRFFFNRDGQAVFWNRAYLETKYENDGTVTVMQGLTYAYGRDLANVVRVTCRPRTISGTVTLWSLDESMTVPAGGERTVRANFAEQESGRRVGGINLVTPNLADGSLAYSGGIVSVNMSGHGQSAEITLNNAGNSEALVTTLVVKGQRLTSWNVVEAEARDAMSVSYYGLRELRIPADLLDNFEQAWQIANYELARRKEPRGEVSSLTLMNRDDATQALMLNLTVGNRLHVAETQTAHAADYVIIGEEHQVRRGLHQCTWFLEPASTLRFWLLGVDGGGELGETTSLGL